MNDIYRFHAAGTEPVTVRLQYAENTLNDSRQPEAYQVLEQVNLASLSIDGVAAGPYDRPIIPAGATLTLTANEGGGELVTRMLVPPSLALATATLTPAHAEWGVTGAGESRGGVLAYRIAATVYTQGTSSPQFALTHLPGMLPGDTQVTAAREGFTPRLCALRDQQPGDWMQPGRAVFGNRVFKAYTQTLTLNRAGGGALPSLTVVDLDPAAASNRAARLNLQTIAVEEDTGSGFVPTTLCPTFLVGTFPPQLFGEGAARPSTWPPNLPFFDPALGRPIWRTPAGGWVDATGAAV